MARLLSRNLAPFWRLPSKFLAPQKAYKSDDEGSTKEVDCSKYAKRDDDDPDKPLLMPISLREATATAEELEHENKWRTHKIEMPKVENLTGINQIPEELQLGRTARIYKEAKNAMQSGSYNTRFWKVSFDTQERWENPNLGWTSCGDPVSNVKLNFRTLADAVRHCENNGWDYYVDRPKDLICYKVRGYSSNYAWNKRHRVSTK